MVGEKALNVNAYTTGGWYYDEPFFVGNTPGSSSRRDGLLIVKDVRDYTYKDRWGSAHPASANFLHADGSVHLLASGTDPGVVAALLALE